MTQRILRLAIVYALIAGVVGGWITLLANI